MNENYQEGTLNVYKLKDKARQKSITITTLEVNGQEQVLNTKIGPLPKKKPFNWKKAVSTVLVTGAITVGILGGARLYGDWRTANNIKLEAGMQANMLLVEYDLNVAPIIDNDGTYDWNNNYGRMNITENDLYGLVCYLGKDEAEKLLPNLGYSNWDEFFTAKNSFDKDGKPSSIPWAVAEANRIAEQMAANKGAKK